MAEHASRAQALIDARKYMDALELLDRALEQHSQQPDLYLKRWVAGTPRG